MDGFDRKSPIYLELLLGIGALAKNFYPLVERTARSTLPPDLRHEAEDVAQDVFVKALLYRAGGRVIENESAFLKTTARNVAKDRRKSRECEKPRHEHWEQRRVDAKLTSEDDIISTLQAKRILCLLMRAIESLPAEHQERARAVLEDWSAAEYAEQAKITNQNARQRKCTARKDLAATLESAVADEL